MSDTFTGGSSFHARLYDAVCGHMERVGLLERRRALVGDLTGEVIELGAGTGKNLVHYPNDAHVYASDFDPVMLARAIPRAAASPADVELLLADAQRLPFKDDSADTVVIGLMLCSVPDPTSVTAEVSRVLRPGGRLRFVEHIRAPDRTLRARIQDGINPIWRRISGGCNANRRTVDTVRAAGFTIENETHFNLGHSHIAPHAFVEAVLR